MLLCLSSYGRRLQRDSNLKDETDRPRVAPWCKKMRAAKGRMEIVERLVIRDIRYRHLQRHPRTFLLIEEVIHSHSQIERMMRRDAGRVVIVIFRPRGRNANTRCAHIGLVALLRREH